MTDFPIVESQSHDTVPVAPVIRRSGSAKLISVPKLGSDTVNSFKEVEREVVDYVIYTLTPSEDMIVVQDSPLKGTSNYSEMLSKLPDQSPRVVLLNMFYSTVSGGKRVKSALILWVPETLTRESLRESCRVKMQGVAMFGLLKAALKGKVNTFVESDQLGDLEYQDVLMRVARYELDPIAL